MPFDRSQPQLRTTAIRIRATAVGAASPTRLWAALGVGLTAAMAFSRISGAWWLSCWPMCVACFSLWGLAEKATQDLDLRRVQAPGARATLATLRMFAVMCGVVAASIGLALMMGLAMHWGWALDVIG